MIALIVKRIKTTEAEEFLSKYGALFEQFNFKGLSSCYFYLIFAVRRYSIIAAILFFSNPLFQILISFIFSIIVIVNQTCLYLLFVSPFKDKINQTSLVFNEALTAAFYGYFLFQSLKLIGNDSTTQGDNCIKIIDVALGINCVFGVISGVYNVFQVVKNFRKRKIVPINNNFVTKINYNDTKAADNNLETKKMKENFK